MRSAEDRRGPRADSGAVSLLRLPTPSLPLDRDRLAANRDRMIGRTGPADVSRGPRPRMLEGLAGAESAFGGLLAIVDPALTEPAASPRLPAIVAAPPTLTPRDA